jgi:hypothetical protein
MAGIRGVNTSHPCPICLVTKEDLDQYITPWVPRNAQETQGLVSLALENGDDEIVDGIEEQLKDIGFRLIDVRALRIFSDF